MHPLAHTTHEHMKTSIGFRFNFAEDTDLIRDQQVEELQLPLKQPTNSDAGAAPFSQIP